MSLFHLKSGLGNIYLSKKKKTMNGKKIYVGEEAGEKWAEKKKKGNPIFMVSES